MPNYDTTKIKKTSYDLFLAGKNLGLTKVDTPSINIAGRISTAEADQIASDEALANFDGFRDLYVDVTFLDTSPEFIMGTLLEGMYGYRAGSAGALYGMGDPNIDLSSMAKELVLIPTANPVGSRVRSFVLWKAYPDLRQNIQIVGSKNNWQQATIRFRLLPDFNQDRLFRYMAWGNLDAEGGDPKSLVIVANKFIPVQNGSRQMNSITLKLGGAERLRTIRFDWALDTVTALVNDATGLLVGETLLVLDALNVNTSLAVGDYIIVGTEVMRISSVPLSYVSSGSFGVVRGALGTTEAVQADNAVVTKLKNVYGIDWTEQAEFSSGTPANVTVGNNRNDETEQAKGFLTAKTPATSSVITATSGATSQTITVSVA